MKNIFLVAMSFLLLAPACSNEEGRDNGYTEIEKTESDELEANNSDKFWDIFTAPVDVITDAADTVVDGITGLLDPPEAEDPLLLDPLLGPVLDFGGKAADTILEEATLGLGNLGSVILTGFNAYRFLALNRNHISAAPAGQTIPKAANPEAVPDTFASGGTTYDSDDFLQLTGSGSLIVIKKLDGVDTIVHEDYFNGQNAHTQFESWSVMKSILSTMIGLAIEDGYISDVNDYVSDYLSYIGPESAFYDATLVDLLEMASGVDFTETYDDPTADIIRLQATLSNPFKGFEDHAQEYPDKLKDENGNDRAPGTYHSYRSIDSQVLGLVLDTALGEGLTIHQYIQDRLWHPAGMTSPAYMLADKDGMPATYSGFRATSRDYAKIGLLYLNGGLAQNGDAVLPEDVVVDNVRADKPHLQVNGDPAFKDYDIYWGYGRQWWITKTDENFDATEYMAVGVFNQFIYVNTEENVVIAKNSGNPNYLLNDYEEDHLQFFRAIVDRIKGMDDDSSPATATVNLLGAHSMYFVSEGGGGATVNANRIKANAWETFRMETTADADCISHGDTITIRAGSGHLWSAQPNGALDSNRTATGPWEEFELINHSDSSGCLEHNDSISLRSIAHNKYVVAQFWGTALANRSAIGAWEKIKVKLH